MNTPQGIIIYGANGGGKSTLGAKLAEKFGCKHMDIEDYYFIKSEIPYTVSRTKDEVIKLILTDIEKYGTFIFFVTCDFSEEITSKYDLAIHITAPLEIRMERIKIVR